MVNPGFKHSVMYFGWQQAPVYDGAEHGENVSG
jgi:hypothetical protein